MLSRSTRSALQRALVALPLALACTAMPPASGQTSPPLQTSVRAGERATVTHFIADSFGDVLLGRLGERKAQNPAVRALARAMVRDHTRTAESGLWVARQIADADAARKAGDENQIELVHLARYDGARFDREYVSAMIEAHKSDISTARDALEFATTPAVRTYLRNTIAIDERHLAMAQAAQQEVGAGD